MRLLSEAEIARLRRRWGEPAFAAAREELAGRAERALREGIDIPVEGGGWTHDYFCPDHAVRLEYDPAGPRAHRCPVDGRLFSGEPYDGAWRTLTNTRMVEGLHAAALVWLAGGEERHAAHAREVLTTYAARYPGYEVHGEHAGKGRCMGQSLDEAVWSIPLARAYDAVRETLAPEGRERIERDLLRPAAEHLLGQLWRRIHNIECWHLAGLATLGAVLDDERFIAPVLDEQYGLAAQLAGGAAEDGWWWEGSPNYHFYTLRAVLSLATAIRRRRPDLLAQPRLRAMLDAPLALMRADLSLPATNDGWFEAAEPGFVARHAPLYELACAFWGEPAHAALLARLYAGGETRRSVEALLFGPDALPAPAAIRLGSIVQDPSGYAVLRGGAGDRERWLLLKYGPHGGGHGHPDKLALDLHAFGRPLSPDLGTPGYGIPLNKTWYRHTLAHNTVLLDGAAQPMATGELVRFVPPADGGFGVADARVAWPADAPAPYAGVELRRCILWKPSTRPYFLDVVRVRCPGTEPRRIDLAWHHVGALELPGLPSPPPATLPDTGEAYAHLSAVGAVSAREWHGVWRGDGVGTACWALDPPGGALIAARAPYNPAAETMSLVLRRVTATEATFAAVFAPFAEEDPAAIRKVSWAEYSTPNQVGFSVLIEGDGIRDAWAVAERGQAPGLDARQIAETTYYEYILDPPAR